MMKVVGVEPPNHFRAILLCINVPKYTIFYTLKSTQILFVTLKSHFLRYLLGNEKRANTNSFQTNVPFSYTLKSLENQRFSMFLVVIEMKYRTGLTCFKYQGLLIIVYF